MTFVLCSNTGFVMLRRPAQQGVELRSPLMQKWNEAGGLDAPTLVM